MRELVVRGASVWRDGAWRDDDLVLRDGVVATEATGGAAVVDASELQVVPGLIDVQCNGALGIDLATEPERLWELAALLPRWGVTAWLPTIVTTPPEITERALVALAAGPPDGWQGAVPLGLHLEGPFLAATKRGAHRETLLRAPTRAAAADWSRAAGVAMVTLAPELDGAVELIQSLTNRGVVASLGHSAATAEQATAGVEAGASSVTHLFNAMAPLHHRAPGLAGVALTDPRLQVGLIADGVHVTAEMVAVARAALGDRLVLVTDSVAALGMGSGAQALGGARVRVDQGAVRLGDGTLAGSVLSLDQAVRNLIAFTACPLEVAVAAASTAPARLLRDPSRGSLHAGARADAVVLDPDLQIVATIVSGQIVHDAR